MNATELIELLQDLPDPDNTEVRIATQPRWPFEHGIYATDDNQNIDPSELDDPDYPNRDDFDFGPEGAELYNEACQKREKHIQEHPEILTKNQPPVFYILEGSQIGYLPAGIGENQGWRG